MAKGQNKFDVVIVGTGHGGAQAAISLRQQGFSGSVLMVGRDPELPYERPPLSKEYLAREKTFERIQIRPLQFWSDKGIDIRLGESVVLVDAKAHRVKLASGAEFEYGVLVWATGGDPRLLACSGAELAGLHAVRDRSDVDRIMAELDGGAKRVVIIGGGYIGLEAAGVMTKLGCSVSLVEMQARVLERVAGPELSAFYEAEHRAHGVDLRTSTTVECIEGDGTRATGVRLAGGEILPADLVIVGIGIVPAVQLLAEAGAACSNGVEVDEYCRTSLVDIYAIGDCAAHANAFAGGAVIRLESVQNANDMAHVVAAAICGAPHPYAATPWFWSNQYDLKLQTVGLNIGHSVRVLRGDPATRSFSVIYLRDGVVVALDCVNAMKDFVQGRKLVEARSTPDPAKLADPDTPLKQLL